MNWRHNARSDITTVPSVGAPPTDGEPEPPAPNSRRNLVLGLILALIAVGLAAVLILRADSDDGGTSAASPTSLAPVQTSTPTTTPAQPPPLLNTGEDPDWGAMVRSMLAYDTWLRRNPNPELLQQWMLSTSPLYADARQTLEKLAAGEWRYDRPYEPLTADIVNLTSRHGSSAVVFLRYAPIPARRVVDRAGNTVLDQPAQPPNSAVWTLLRDSAGRWRFDKAERL